MIGASAAPRACLRAHADDRPLFTASSTFLQPGSQNVPFKFTARVAQSLLRGGVNTGRNTSIVHRDVDSTELFGSFLDGAKSGPSCVYPSEVAGLFLPIFRISASDPGPPYRANPVPRPAHICQGQRNCPSNPRAARYQRHSPIQRKLRILHSLPPSFLVFPGTPLVQRV